MEPLTIAAGLFIYGLYKATEKIWEKGLDAAWTPVDEALKTRFTRWAGRGQEAERRAAFEKAAAIARANTLRTAADPQQAGRILDALNGERDKKGAEALALSPLSFPISSPTCARRCWIRNPTTTWCSGRCCVHCARSWPNCAP
jgi:hypothetical protein